MMGNAVNPLCLRLSLAILALSGAWTGCDASEFFNKIAGQPTVECGQGSLRLTVETTTPEEPPSRIFVKGHSEVSSCAFLATKEAEFSLTGCDMQRQRQLTPRGLFYSLTVVVQMHPLFVTKVDRAYNIKCFYMEADKTVTANFDVSMLTTSQVTAGMEMPTCTYTIHRETQNGPLVRYAEVGDKVIHVWECPGESYGMVVHSCYVDDAAGNRIQILDAGGCGTDQVVMRTPLYSADGNSAMQETHVFKFADKINVRFNCQIKLCIRTDGGCEGLTVCLSTAGFGLLISVFAIMLLVVVAAVTVLLVRHRRRRGPSPLLRQPKGFPVAGSGSPSCSSSSYEDSSWASRRPRRMDAAYGF